MLELLTTKEAIHALGVSERTFHRWVVLGVLRPLVRRHQGLRVVRYKPDDITGAVERARALCKPPGVPPGSKRAPKNVSPQAHGLVCFYAA